MRPYLCVCWLVFAFVVFACQSSIGEQTASARTEAEEPRMRSRNVSTQFSEEGRLRVLLEAPLQEEFASGDTRFPEGIFILHYDDRGMKKAELRADSGFFFDEEGIYEARGSVQLNNLSAGSELQTEKLSWNPQSQRVYTDKAVRIQTGEEIHTGEGLSASEDFKDYHILRPSGTMEVKETKSE